MGLRVSDNYARAPIITIIVYLGLPLGRIFGSPLSSDLVFGDFRCFESMSQGFGDLGFKCLGVEVDSRST